MLKKWTIPLILALLASLTAGSVAFAQAEGPEALAMPRPPRGGKRAVGQVLSLGENQFTLGTRAGKEQTVNVDSSTRYVDENGEKLTFEDLQIDGWVAVLARYTPNGDLIARLVILLPQDYDPSQRLGQHARGNILEVDGSAGTFTVHTLRGEEVTFTTNDNTIFRGEAAGLGDLQEDMQVWVSGLIQSDGSLLALVVIAGNPDARHAGTIESVAPSAGSFVLKALSGEQYTYLVTAETRFHSRWGQVQSLSDLRQGMHAVVAAERDENGSLIARVVWIVRIRR